MLRILMAVVLTPLALAASPDDLMGDWIGESACAVKASACRDETVIYHLAQLPEKPNMLSVSADKIVDGKPVNMGTLEFRYDAGQHLLTWEYAQGTWRIKVEGTKMEGTLTRPDQTVFRRLILHKESWLGQT